MIWYPGKPSTAGDLLTRDPRHRVKQRLLDPQSTGGLAVVNGLAPTADLPYTPATGVPVIGSWPEDCQAGYDPDWGNQYKRVRTIGHKGQRAKSRLRNRKAAKAARKARKK